MDYGKCAILNWIVYTKDYFAFKIFCARVRSNFWIKLRISHDRIFLDSETISTETFYLVQKQMDQYYEMMIVDKKKIPVWSRRLHVALKAYQVRNWSPTFGFISSMRKEIQVFPFVYYRRNFYTPWWRWIKARTEVYENPARLSKVTCFTSRSIERLFFHSYFASTKSKCHGLYEIMNLKSSRVSWVVYARGEFQLLQTTFPIIIFPN